MREVLQSGAGLRKLREFVANQGGDTAFIGDPGVLEPAPVQRELFARNEGWVQRIDAEAIGRASVEIGAGRKVKTDRIDPQWDSCCTPRLGTTWQMARS